MGDSSIFLTQAKKNRLSFELNNWHSKGFLAIVDLCILLSSLFFFHSRLETDLSLLKFIQDDSPSLIFGITLFLALSMVFDLYSIEQVNKTRKVLPLAFFIGLFWTVSYVVDPFQISKNPFNKTHVFSLVAGFTMALVTWRVLYASVIHSMVFHKNFILLAAAGRKNSFLEQIKDGIEGNQYDHGLKVLRIYQVPDKEDQASKLARAIDRMASQKIIDSILILDEDQEWVSNRLNTTLVKVLRYGVQIKTYFKLYEEVKEALPLQLAGSQLYNILPVSKYNNNYGYLLWHRFLNISSALAGLTLMVLLCPFILVLNIFFNRGPLFYRQMRIGKGGKEIRIIKFRSMIVEAEHDGAKMSTKGDLRITSFGKILRMLRLDELPQFWLVLKGEMSLIGPRPERRVFIDDLVKSIPLYDARHMIRPGITGWAQVKYDYGETLGDSHRKLEYDLYYIKNRSVTLDLRIIFKTINTILLYKGR